MKTFLYFVMLIVTILLANYLEKNGIMSAERVYILVTLGAVLWIRIKLDDQVL